MQWPQKLIIIWCEMNLKQIPDVKIKIKRESEIIFEKIVFRQIVLPAAQYWILNIQFSSCYKALHIHHIKNFIT